MTESMFLSPAAAVRAAKIHEGMLVADFGSGSGFFTRAAARAVGPQGRVWAVDAHADLLTRVKNLALGEGLHNVEILHGNVEKQGGSGLPPTHFDFVLATNLFFSADEKKALVDEVRRVLKKNGRALVIDWSASHGGLGPHQSHVVKAADILKLFEAEGFTHVEDVPAGAYHWGFVVRKKLRESAQ